MSQSVPNPDVISRTQPRPHKSKVSDDLAQEAVPKRPDLKMTLEDSQVIEYMNHTQNNSAQITLAKPRLDEKSATLKQSQNIEIARDDPYEGKVSSNHLDHDDQHDQQSTDSEGKDKTRISQNIEVSVHQSVRMTEETPKQATKDQLHLPCEGQRSRQHQGITSQGSRNTLQFINEPVQSETKLVNCSNDAPSIMKEMPAKISLCSSINKLSKFQNLKFEIFAWGLNNHNQLGLQSHVSPRMFGSCNKSVLIPRRLKEVQFDPELIACGLEHTLIVTQNGELWGMGSTQEFALGLSKRQVDGYMNELVKIDLPLPDHSIQSIYCGYYHSILQLKNGQILGCGSNANNQLGIRNGNQTVKEFTSVPIQSSNIEAISCGPYVTSFLDIQNQILYQCGQIGEKMTNGIELIDLQSEIRDETIIDVKQGKSCVMVMSQNGRVYHKIENGPFELIQQVSKAREFAASGENYAILSYCNNVFEWREDFKSGFRKIENSFSKVTTFTDLSLGSDFGHVIDSDSNLYGWGNNKNGELGTGDSYPRPRLSQIRIFNNDKQYMRCFRVFGGPNHAIACFESNISPNGIGNNNESAKAAVRGGSINSLGHKPSNYMISPQMKQQNLTHETSNSQQKPKLPLPPNELRRKNSNSIDFSPAEIRRMQYQKTEEALKKYREQAQSYRENIKKIRQHISNDQRQSQHHSANDLRNENLIKPPKAKSISPIPNLKYGHRREINLINQGMSMNTFSFQQSVENADHNILSHQNFTLNAFHEMTPEQQVLLKSKFAKRQMLSSNNFLVKESNTSLPEIEQVQSDKDHQTFAPASNQRQNLNNINQDSERDMMRVQLNKKIEKQVANAQNILNLSRSQRSNTGGERSNKGVISPPTFNQGRNSQNVTNNNYNQSISKSMITNFNDPINLNFSNQRLSNVVSNDFTPSSYCPHNKANITSVEDDTYELSQSIYPNGVIGSDLQTAHPYQHDLPMNPTSNKKRNNSNKRSQKAKIQMIQTVSQTGNTITESETLNQSQERGRNINPNGNRAQNAHNFTNQVIYQTQRPVYNQNGFIKEENDYSPSPIATNEKNGQYGHQRQSSSHNDTSNNTFFNDKSQMENVHDLLNKLNKYRRKLKKYINRNQEQQKEIDFYKGQAEEFQGQNARIIRVSQQEEERMKKKLQIEQDQFNDYSANVEQERQEKQKVINNLTEENINLVSELKERDFQHNQLDAKMNEVHMHVAEVTQQLNQYLTENRDLQQENQQLYDQVLEKEQVIRDLEFEIENHKIKEESKQKHIDEGRDKTILMLEQTIKELLEQNKKKDKDLIEMRNKVNYLKNKRKEAKKQSKDLEFTVRDLQSQLILSQQKAKAMFFPRNEKMSTIDEIPVGPYQEVTPNMSNRHELPRDQSNETFTNNPSTKRSQNILSAMGTVSENNNSALRQQVGPNSFDDYNNNIKMQRNGEQRSVMSHTNSSRFTTTTHINQYNYGPDIRQKLQKNAVQQTPVARQDVNERNQTDMNEDSTNKSFVQDVSKRKNQQSRSSNRIISDKSAQNHQEQHFKKQPRAKSGPSESMFDFKNSVKQEQIMSTRNVQDMIVMHGKNPSQQSNSYMVRQSNPFTQHPNQNFPNLQYVNQRYYNPENQSYTDNYQVSAVRNYNPMSDHFSQSPGQHSQMINSFARNTNRMSDIPSQIMQKQIISSKDLQNKSTQVQPLIQSQTPESKVIGVQCQIEQPLLKDKNNFSPRQIEDFTPAPIKSKSQSNFKQNEQAQQQMPSVINSVDKFKPNIETNTLQLNSMSVNGLQQSNMIDSQDGDIEKPANLTYKDLLLNKMNQKVNVIQNILNRKKERDVQKDIVQEEKLNQSLEILDKPDNCSSFDQKTAEHTMNKLNFSGIMANDSTRGRKPSREPIREEMKRSQYVSAENEKDQIKVNSRRQKEISQVNDFRESSKSWEQRRGKSTNSSEFNSKEVMSKYREAYRDLSQEIKRKISRVQKDIESDEFAQNINN